MSWGGVSWGGVSWDVSWRWCELEWVGVVWVEMWVGVLWVGVMWVGVVWVVVLWVGVMLVGGGVSWSGVSWDVSWSVVSWGVKRRGVKSRGEWGNKLSEEELCRTLFWSCVYRTLLWSPGEKRQTVRRWLKSLPLVQTARTMCGDARLTLLMYDSEIGGKPTSSSAWVKMLLLLF